ncbi:hypothetical protein LAV84_30465 [Rhizobium sp. VS19-DR104.2]|uniref:hypothetical protein n=1 Tax=unclassified Rhizobium TaxID=2613769 RepID=UPI001C5AEBD5|nr:MULTISPECIES: hypothetical protein [unclassified Rhizobium]MBZ5763774.1 hypothetical protein [Rhizobium sp. VS19-DR96]MBZ5769711.1 hypothetical protein [Rhizobium sp. VS19-DR129.2]MBZ5777253.1 hypothetical protein [Rhizobium sp. VS19-DRK62.2]MBZ5788376.1 hypothetical protein [Rhizobium sp. VS19-DR121]MBZ5805827.1 hypothetical protein [Rhizobium sp. VS19-DR181]
MISVKALIFSGVLLGLSSFSATAGESLAHKDLNVARSADLTWKVNELHAADSQTKHAAIVDVNDQFVIKSSADNGVTAVKFGILDGERAAFGSCTSLSASDYHPNSGQRHTTWVQFSYSPRDGAGRRNITLQKTADFYGHAKVYNFLTTGKAHEIAQLDEGVTVRIDGDQLTYTQNAGPIGASGNIDVLRLAYHLADDLKEIDANVVLNDKSWDVATARIADDIPIYSVNDFKSPTVLEDRSTVAASSTPVIAEPTIMAVEASGTLVNKVKYSADLNAETSIGSPAITKEIKNKLSAVSQISEFKTYQVAERNAMLKDAANLVPLA